MGQYLLLNEPRMLLFLVGLFFQILSPCFSQQLASNTNQLNNQVANLPAQVNNVQASVRSLQRSTNAATQQANEVAAVLDYSLSSGTKCGPQTITGWTERVDYFRDQATNGGAVSTTKQFIAGTGIFTPQHVGYYQICSYSRFQLGFAPFNLWHSPTQSAFIWNLEEAPIAFRKLD